MGNHSGKSKYRDEGNYADPYEYQYDFTYEAEFDENAYIRYDIQPYGAYDEVDIKCEDEKMKKEPKEENEEAYQERIAKRDAITTNKNWNDEFQKLIEDYAKVQERDEQTGFTQDVVFEKRKEIIQNLLQFQEEFLKVAEELVKIIIEEDAIQSNKRAIPQVDVGGIAGGDKYMWDSIFFKFSRDSHKLFGGDQYAQKASQHELKGLLAIVSVLLGKQLKFPLMGIFTYRGRCITAIASLPINKETLVYGSADAGKTIKMEKTPMISKMNDLGYELFLKSHRVGDGTTNIVGPVDIEGHHGKDGRFYIIDTARLFPCEAPEQSVKKKGCHLYRMLRPELLQHFQKPLSSDAFSRMGQLDKEINNKEVVEATMFLQNKMIPQLVVVLEEEFDSWSGDGSPFDKLVYEFHRKGVNMRFLGVVYRKVKKSKLKDFILMEMIARTARDIVNSKMREISAGENVHYHQTIVSTLNELLNENFDLARNEIAEKFEIDEKSIHSFSDLFEEKNANALMERIEQKLGVSIEFEVDKKSLTIGSIKSSKVLVKYPYFLSLEEGRLLYVDADKFLEKNEDKLEEYEKMLDLAKVKFEQTLMLKSDDIRALYNLGCLNVDKGKILTYKAESERIDHLKKAHVFFEKVASQNAKHRIIFEGQWEELLETLIEKTKESKYRKALKHAKKLHQVYDTEEKRRLRQERRGSMAFYQICQLLFVSCFNFTELYP